MDIYDCDPKWPVCIFDFTFKNINPRAVTFKVYGELSDHLKEDYFYSQDGLDQLLHGKGAAAGDTLHSRKHEDLLIQRNHHVCKHDKAFVEAFKRRYEGADPAMMDSDSLHFDIDNPIDATRQIEQFVAYVKSPISQALRESALESARRGRLKAQQREEQRKEEQRQVEQQKAAALPQATAASSGGPAATVAKAPAKKKAGF